MSDELFAKTPEEAAASIRRVLRNERHMREIVFEHNPPVRAKKVDEIDRALADLQALEDAAKGDPRA